MSALIGRVRLLIADPAGASQQFQDQDIQDTLDASRMNIRYAVLRPQPTLQWSGVYNYTDYYADVDWWEDDIQLVDSAFNTLTPATTDNITGHWTFVKSPNGQLPPVFIVGKYYDTYAAAANLLEMWAAAWARNYSFATEGNSFSRNQATQNMLALAAQYRKQARPRKTLLTRDDIDSTSGGLITILGNDDVIGGW